MPVRVERRLQQTGVITHITEADPQLADLDRGEARQAASGGERPFEVPRCVGRSVGPLGPFGGERGVAVGPLVVATLGEVQREHVGVDTDVGRDALDDVSGDEVEARAAGGSRARRT